MDPYAQTKSRRKQTTLVVVGVLVAVILFGLMRYAGSFQQLRITIDPAATGTTTDIYLSDDRSKPIRTNITADKQLRLQKNRYVLITTGEGYEQLTTSVDLKEQSQTVLLSPQLTPQKLAQILQAEKPAIDTAITQALGAQKLKGFTVQNGKLYKTGQWYGTTITQTQTKEQARLTYTDTFRLIARKDPTGWRVVTIPPELLLSHTSYPDIPREILVDVNKNPD